MFCFIKSLFIKPKKRENGVSVRDFYNESAEKIKKELENKEYTCG